jgi:hypothetical protein
MVVSSFVIIEVTSPSLFSLTSTVSSISFFSNVTNSGLFVAV